VTELVPPAANPAEFEIQSTVARVTLFEDRAEVVRKASCAVPAGVSWVRLYGIATMVSDPSVLPSVYGGPARVLTSRVVRRVREVPLCDQAEVLSAAADCRAAVARRIAAERALEAATAHEARITALTEAWIVALRRVPRAAQSGLSAWRSAQKQLSTQESAVLDDVAAKKSELQAAQLDEARANLRQQQARRTQPRFEAAIELQLEAATAGELSIEVAYRTPCALWRPEHLCRLISRSDGMQVAITTWATAWQCTGEDWSGVPLRFSTARPTQVATPPLLSEDNLRLRRKTDAEKRSVVIEVREQAIAIAGLSRGVHAVEEMPGVDDGGELLLFEAARPVTLPSNGQPLRIEIGSLTLPCQVERVAYPELGPSIHLRATATLSGPRPLLAGPIHVFRGSELCGRGHLGYVGRGEPFEIGFGLDDGLRIRRQLEESRETTPVVGTQKIARTIKLYVSNLGSERRRLLISERVPVSEHRDIEITVGQSSGMRFEPKDGFAQFDLDIEGRATRELQLGYRIEAASRVVLPI
jgi:uncharacterized protein (TIGR02231 family)